MANNVSLFELCSRSGDLGEIFGLFDPNTIRTSSEILAIRRDEIGKNVKYQWGDIVNNFFYTSQFAEYCIEDGKPVMYFGARTANPIFADFENAHKQLSDYVYLGDPEDPAYAYYKVPAKAHNNVKAAAKRGNVLRVEMDGLRLRQLRPSISYFTPILFSNESERKLAKLAYGSFEPDGDGKCDFEKNTEALGRSFMNTQFRLYSPEFVMKHAAQGPIAWICSIETFERNYNFEACNNSLYDSSSLCGRLKESDGGQNGR